MINEMPLKPWGACIQHELTPFPALKFEYYYFDNPKGRYWKCKKCGALYFLEVKTESENFADSEKVV